MKKRKIITFDTDAGAEFSPCRKFRYHLHRVWDRERDTQLFILLNPSTADEFKLDPTLRRCEGYARKWAAGGFEVLNIFAYRATDPRDLIAAGFPIGDRNDDYFIDRAHAHRGRVVICGWGSNAEGLQRPHDVMRILHRAGARPHALGITRGFMPKHPLYLRADARPVPF
jgi:hypothetical protein